jgi:hypothetical protein
MAGKAGSAKAGRVLKLLDPECRISAMRGIQVLTELRDLGWAVASAPSDVENAAGPGKARAMC